MPFFNNKNLKADIDMKKSIAAACIAWALTGSASALVLDFNAHPLGSTITDEYAAQGLRFEGVITGRTLENGTFLQPGFTLYVDPSILNPRNEVFGISFLAFSPVDVHIDVFNSAGQTLESGLVSGLANPFCSTRAECEAGGYHYTLDRWTSVSLWLPSDAYKITFSGVAVDNMYFGTNASPVNPGVPRTEIPEPGSLALIGLGLAGIALAGLRRRR